MQSWNTILENYGFIEYKILYRVIQNANKYWNPAEERKIKNNNNQEFNRRSVYVRILGAARYDDNIAYNW